MIAIWALGLFAACVLIGLQYARPRPLGGAYVLHPQNYLRLALSYEAFGLLLLSTPSLLLAFMPMSERVWKLGSALQITLLTLSLLLSQLNHELQRFMGAQLDWDTLITYFNVFRTPAVIWQALHDDQGGAYSALSGDLVAVAFAALAYGCCRLPRSKLPVLVEALIAGVFVIAGGVQPLVDLHQSRSVNRELKLRPPLVLLWDSAREGLPDERRYVDVQAAIARWQQDWLAQDGSGQYRFDDARYPLRHHRITPFPGAPDAVDVPMPNIILLSLETFRARDMGTFNPELQPSPTPFLDGLAHDPDSAYYPRYITNGLPTIFAFMSLQTGTLPHSRRVVASSFTGDALDAFPNLLRERGYKTMFFTASDPNWDNELFWLARWYDETHYKHTVLERDRAMFLDAAEHIVQAGRSGQPFLATIASINNHSPFRSPDHAFDVSSGKTPSDRIHNTMHYTDDVVRQFVERLRGERWFKDTVLIVTGDHGYDLGERGSVIGHDNLRHESTWVPLIIHGRNVRLPRGEQTRVASHIDLAPTIAQLAGSTRPHSFEGHSLLEPATDRQLAIAVRNGNFGLEANDFSAYVPAHGTSVIYDVGDRLQRYELHKRAWPALSQTLARARDASLVTDWAFEHDRFAPTPSNAPSLPVAAVGTPSAPSRSAH
ncbi:MAG TPA: LTA synthase family protein [Polyangiales bacterium]|nr:LTA synthase family protein [Polyangiales bacterium]